MEGVIYLGKNGVDEIDAESRGENMAKQTTGSEHSWPKVLMYASGSGKYSF